MAMLNNQRVYLPAFRCSECTFLGAIDTIDPWLSQHCSIKTCQNTFPLSMDWLFREKNDQKPIFHGKIYGFRLRFS